MGALARQMTRLASEHPSGGIEDIAITPDEAVITGWVANPSRRTVRRVHILIPGRAPVTATLTTAEPAVLRWQATVVRHGLPEGGLTIRAVAEYASRRKRVVATAEAQLHGELLIGRMDEPDSGATNRSSALAVRGWARLGHVDHVTIEVGAVVARARMMAEPRPDIADVLPDPDAPLAGWDALVPIVAEPGDELRVRATAATADGERTLGEGSITYDPYVRPIADPARLELLRQRNEDHVPRGIDRLRVLVVAHHLGLGGAQLYLQELLRLLREGHRITVLASADGELRDQLEAWGVEVQIVAHPPTAGEDYEQWIRQMLGLVGPVAPGIVIANTAVSYWGVDLAVRMNRPAVWVIHESFPVEVLTALAIPADADVHVRERFMAAFSEASRCVFVADATAALFADLIPAGRSMRIDYGLDLTAVPAPLPVADRAALRERLGLPREKTVLLCVGRYEARKAQGLLTAVFARVADEFPETVLALVGDFPSTYSQGVDRVIGRLKLQDRVFRIPLTRDVEDWYAAADAFVLASDVESLPRTLLEAMAQGLPVIAARVFGIPELITDGQDGYLFEPSSARSLEDALRRFLNASQAERGSISEEGRRVIRDTRSSQSYAGEFAALMAELARE
jgi:glycosyltransferase involved in cell wall biosynthesis